MAQSRHFIKGVDFNEGFFDAAIKGAGGYRLLERHDPPPETQHVDYIIQGYALELKILESDPLDSVERQTKLATFFKAEFPKGPLWYTATKRQGVLTGELSKKFWEWYLGAPLQDRLYKASKQIADTHTFVPGLLGGGVILVNAGGDSLDWQGFINLTNHHQDRFESINLVFALNGVVSKMDNGEFQIHSGMIAKQEHREKASALDILLSNAIGAEMAQRTGKTLRSVQADAMAPSKKATFQFTPTGLRKKSTIGHGTGDTL